MYSPSKIKIEDKTSLGVLIFTPNKEAIDVASIGPRNQASGILI